MTAIQNPALILAGAASFVASAAHLACIAGGGSWYRFMGAGERMARAAESGQLQASAITLCIATVLAIWGLYAWSGAGLLPRLPLLPWVLVAITAIYLARGLFFLALQSRFPGNSAVFWYVSSGICTAIGLAHVVGLRQMWLTSNAGVA